MKRLIGYIKKYKKAKEYIKWIRTRKYAKVLGYIIADNKLFVINYNIRTNGNILVVCRWVNNCWYFIDSQSIRRF